MKRALICSAISILATIPLLLNSCSSSPVGGKPGPVSFEVKNFVPLANWGSDSADQGADLVNPKQITLDFSDAIASGFIIPTVNQVKEGMFEFTFNLKNPGASPQKYFYKIYYQNESYKMPECDEYDSTQQHIYAGENFYGSWENVKVTFRETPEIPADGQFHKITDRFRIVGNPRDEKKYYSEGNDRWKRNPRVGKYSFMLIVTSRENISKKIIPEYVQDISLQDDQGFVNPFFFFLHGPGKKLPDVISVLSPVQLKVTAKPDPGSGIFIQPKFIKSQKNEKYFCESCGTDSSLYRNAAFEQFIHYIDPSTKMENIPVIADVMKDNYSMTDYNWNAQFYRKEELISVTATTTRTPCQTVVSDPVRHSITLKNPGTKFGEWEKQNVGIITRQGLTYGKWTVKARLPKIVNRNNLWNGLTNAIWLITQDPAEWNSRRDCTKEGYLENYYGGREDKRVKSVSYSEIDFEILKTVSNCPVYEMSPAYSYGIPDASDISKWNVAFPEEIVKNPGQIQVACTNWDMACWEPREFGEGCKTVTKDGQTFWAHRWDLGYRALTERTPEMNDELFGSEYYYFQIEWEPTKITWRIGPSKDKLRVVGYEDNTITSVPNNQMLLIISQEFHNTKWWIGSPYSQDNIPFPKNDITGEIFEVTIE
jgi:hypothetical protein